MRVRIFSPGLTTSNGGLLEGTLLAGWDCRNADREGKNKSEERIENHIGIGRFANWVRGVCILGLGTRPDVNLVVGDLRLLTSLEVSGVELSHVQPRRVIKAVDPALGVGLSAINGGNVVRFTVVVLCRMSEETADDERTAPYPGDELNPLRVQSQELVPAVEPEEVAREDPVLRVGDLRAVV